MTERKNKLTDFPLKLSIGLIFLFLFHDSLHAQYFSKRYLLYGGTTGYISSIQIVNDTIYAMCYVGDSIEPELTIAVFERFDKYGNLISATPLDTSSLINICVNNNTVIHTNDGGFAYGGYLAGDTANQYIVVILKYDHYGNFEWYKEIVDDNCLAFNCEDIIQDSFSNYYITGLLQNPLTYDADMYLAKTDSNGNLIYKKQFLHPYFDDIPGSLTFNNHGHVIMGGVAAEYSAINMDTAVGYMEIYELDTAGNQLRYVLGTDTNGPLASNIIVTNDGGYLIASAYICSRQIIADYGVGSISKLDSNFNQIWKTDIGPCSQFTEFYAQALSPDGNYIAVGQSYDDTDTPFNHVNGWIVKYSEDGQIIWNKLYRGITSYGPQGDDNPLGSLAFMSDGSIICAGQATDYDDTMNSQQGWLLHLDTAGCLPDSNTCGLPDGIVHIPQSIGNVNLYPNPAQDMITIDFGAVDWSIYERLSLKVKDITGQELYSSDLPRFSAIHRMNISAYAPGMYMIEIQDDQGVVLAVRKWVKE